MPVRAIVHKLRKAMGEGDSRYTIEGMIEFDEGHLTEESSEIKKQKAKIGRGAVGKQNVAPLAVSTPLEYYNTSINSNH